MQILMNTGGIAVTNCFVIADETAKQAVLFDAPDHTTEPLLEVIHTPGHSPGHVMFHLASEKILIGGDLIIGGSIGRTDLPDSDHAALEDSIRKIMKLPAETRLLPGHGDISTLEAERESNTF